MDALRWTNFASSALFRLSYGRVLGKFGRGSRVVRPIGIERPDRIFIEEDVFVAPATGLQVYDRSDAGRLEIGRGCKIGRFNHIYAYGLVRLEEKVLTANGVYISDNTHAFADIDTPVMDQPVEALAPTVIGSGTWLGQNAAVFGASIGRQCVIAANSVVNRDIPDFSVVVGVNRIVRRFDPDRAVWRRTVADGTFVD